MPEPITKGSSSPLGATVSREGANFSVYSKHATGINSWLLNFSSRLTICDDTPCRVTLGTIKRIRRTRRPSIGFLPQFLNTDSLASNGEL
jgi:pullulanase/glycogen debranching enzyme